MTAVNRISEEGRAIKARMAELERRERFERLFGFFRSCAACSSYMPPISYLCESCWREIPKRANAGVVGGYPFNVRSLFTWTPETEDWLAPMIYAQKGGFFPLAMGRLGGLFLVQQFGAGQLSFPDLRLLAAPGAGLDHAGVFAESLATLIGGSVHFPFLETGSAGGQKTKDRSARSERRYRLRSDWTPAPEGRYVFIDDVITTGSTAMAAYMALGDPTHFEVWTLACRPHLAVKCPL